MPGYDDLDGVDQAATRAQGAAGIERESSMDYAARFRAEGRAYSELDEDGNVVRRTPPSEPDADLESRLLADPAIVDQVRHGLDSDQRVRDRQRHRD